MRRPSMAFLPRALADSARGVAERMRSAGHRLWLVGGSVRDLALEREPHDLDVATAARPEQVEAIFPRCVPVGRAFGTLVLPGEGAGVQITTFRRDGQYSDGRRPDQVRWGESVEEDAARRDFTCNALYLDPLEDELLDPTGGIRDLERGVLRCVGDPAERFREDGLRLMRLGRFAAVLGLGIEERTLAAARSEGDALRLISRERIRGELEACFSASGGGAAIGLFHELGLYACILGVPDPAGAALVELLACTAALEPAPGPVLGLAALLDPGAGRQPCELDLAVKRLESLRPSGALCRAVRALWEGLGELERLENGPALDPYQHLLVTRKLARRDDLDALLRLWLAGSGGRQEAVALAAELAEVRAGTPREVLFPEALFGPEELRALGIPQGPQWGRLLREAQELQLGGRLTDRASCAAWLAERARELGGGPPAGRPGV